MVDPVQNPYQTFCHLSFEPGTCQKPKVIDQTGYGYEMEAIAACTIGGVSVTGGRGKVSSAIIGVAVFELLKVALQYLGMNANAQYIAIGVVIFIAISLDIRKYIARK